MLCMTSGDGIDGAGGRGVLCFCVGDGVVVVGVWIGRRPLMMALAAVGVARLARHDTVVLLWWRRMNAWRTICGLAGWRVSGFGLLDMCA